MRYLITILLLMSIGKVYAQNSIDLSSEVSFFYQKAEYKYLGRDTFKTLIRYDLYLPVDEKEGIPFESLSTLKMVYSARIPKEYQKDTNIHIILTLAEGRRVKAQLKMLGLRGSITNSFQNLLNDTMLTGMERIVLEFEDKKNRFPSFVKLIPGYYNSDFNIMDVFKKAKNNFKTANFKKINTSYTYNSTNIEIKYNYPITILYSVINYNSVKNNRFAALTFSDCDLAINLDNCRIEKLSFKDCEIKYLELLNCQIDTLIFDNNISNEVSIQNCIIGYQPKNQDQKAINDTISLCLFMNDQVQSLSILNNQIGSANLGIWLNPASEQMILSGNQFFGFTTLRERAATKQFQVLQNKFHEGVCLDKLEVSSHTSFIDFEQFDKVNIAYAEAFYDHRNIEEVLKEDKHPSEVIDWYYLLKWSGDFDKDSSYRKFKELVKTHQVLYNFFREQGDLQAANQIYVRKKQLEGLRLREEYKRDGGFKSYINWMLNRVMKFYTEHGTEPAKAIIISIYTIVFFSFIYFLFPSEWDITSKVQLINNFKTFIEKNEHGYFLPFIKLFFGIFISFINALTLSLNAFTTLGFGNIPTTGFARYICVLQGFLGWFLLSIFSVSLINQVLF